MIRRDSPGWPERLRQSGLLPVPSPLQEEPGQGQGLIPLPAVQGQGPGVILPPAEPEQRQKQCLPQAEPGQRMRPLIPDKKRAGNTGDRSPKDRNPGRETG